MAWICNLVISELFQNVFQEFQKHYGIILGILEYFPEFCNHFKINLDVFWDISESFPGIPKWFQWISQPFPIFCNYSLLLQPYYSPGGARDAGRRASNAGQNICSSPDCDHRNFFYQRKSMIWAKFSPERLQVAPRRWCERAAWGGG